MLLTKQLVRFRRWIFICAVLILFSYIYINSITLPFFNNLKQIFTSLILLYSNSRLKNSERVLFSPISNTPKEGFVTFSDNNPIYLALLTNLLDSVHYFSSRPIIAYGIDVDLDIDVKKYPRLVKRRLSRSDCGRSLYFCKIHAIIESKLDYGVHLEVDSVVNWNVDILFDVVHQWPYAWPLAPRHPTDPRNYEFFLRLFQLGYDNRTIPYIHAQLSWNYRAYPFFKQALHLMRKGYFLGANHDETGINILLWKSKANHTLCKIDPYVGYLPVYESNPKTCKEFCHTAFILLHGSKDPQEMRRIFKRLKKHAGAPFIQTPNDGLHYLNETQYTCCYPDSRTSPIHPLLCEHPTRKR